jgi:hypothetical protein
MVNLEELPGLPPADIVLQRPDIAALCRATMIRPSSLMGGRWRKPLSDMQSISVQRLTAYCVTSIAFQ